MATASHPDATTSPEVFYPSSDGQPLGETGFHVIATYTLFQMLKDFHAHRQDAYVAADMFLYYERGNPRACRAPDCMVCLGVRHNQERKSFKTWEEGVVPSVIFEVSSDQTFTEDLHAKRDVYAMLGVAEYFLFDPVGDCLDPRLRGFRLIGGEYQELEPEADGGLTSQILGLHMYPQQYLLRLVEVRTGRLLPTFEEVMQGLARQTEKARHERRKAKQERVKAEQERLNAEQERLNAEQERLNAEQERLNAEQERHKAEQERLNAEQERRNAERAASDAALESRRAEELAAEVARLRALLDQRDEAAHGD